MKNKLLMCGIFIFVTITASNIWRTWNAAVESNEDSTTSALFMELKQAQESHYAAHNRFAARLADLPTESFKNTDELKAKQLSRFIYQLAPNGQQFTLY